MGGKSQVYKDYSQETGETGAGILSMWKKRQSDPVFVPAPAPVVEKKVKTRQPKKKSRVARRVNSAVNTVARSGKRKAPEIRRNQPKYGTFNRVRHYR